MHESWSEALGGFGPGDRLKALGQEWTFVFDVPLILANYEQLCLEWGRAEHRKILEGLKERNVPDTLDAALAMRESEMFIEKQRGGAFLPPLGSEYVRWKETNEGKLGMVLASLRIRHPEATLNTVIRLMASAPVEMGAILDNLKKTMDEWGAAIRTVEGMGGKGQKSNNSAPANSSPASEPSVSHLPKSP